MHQTPAFQPSRRCRAAESAAIDAAERAQDEASRAAGEMQTLRDLLSAANNALHEERRAREAETLAADGEQEKLRNMTRFQRQFEAKLGSLTNSIQVAEGGEVERGNNKEARLEKEEKQVDEKGSNNEDGMETPRHLKSSLSHHAQQKESFQKRTLQPVEEENRNQAHEEQ